MPCSRADLSYIVLQVSGVRVFLEMRAELANDTAWASKVSLVHAGTDTPMTMTLSTTQVCTSDAAVTPLMQHG